MNRRQSPIIKAGQVRMEPQAVLIDDSSAHAKSSVVLKRQGEMITSIEVTCSCGKKIILDCLYDDVESASLA